MEKLKKALLCLISLLLIFAICSCQFTPQPDDDGDGDGEVTPPADEGGDEGVDEDGSGKFTVTLVYDGKFFKPEYKSDDDVILAQWSDGYNVHTAPVDESGKAAISGLDGDYQVTLSHLPDGYTYNPNVHFSTNDSKDILVDLYKITKTKGSGTNPTNGAIEIKNPGVYRATIKNANHILYFRYKTGKEGTYTIESLVDVNENKCNPLVDIYNVNAGGWSQFVNTIDGGGVEMGYTKNFLFKCEVASENLGDKGQGIEFSFGIKVTSKDGVYPINVDFAIMRNGSFELEHATQTMVIPEYLENGLLKLKDGRTKADFATEAEFIGAFKNEHTYASGKKFKPAEKIVNGNRQHDGSEWGLNEDSGFYQKYNEETGKFDGPILYAIISEPCRHLETAIDKIEDIGSAYLTVSNGTENYKLFIEGYNSLADPNVLYDAGGQFDYNQYKGIEGYADYANKHGAVPVTQELKDFLQKLSIAQLYFRDGNGWCEASSPYPVDSTEEDQWLFACGYYA